MVRPQAQSMSCDLVAWSGLRTWGLRHWVWTHPGNLVENGVAWGEEPREEAVPDRGWDEEPEPGKGQEE